MGEDNMMNDAIDDRNQRIRPLGQKYRRKVVIYEIFRVLKKKFQLKINFKKTFGQF